MKLSHYDVVIEPFMTEKSNTLKDEQRILCFKVHRLANKIEIKQAVEKLFSTEVDTVRVSNFTGKVKRHGRYSGKRPNWKKAYVKLKPQAKMIEYVEVV